MFLDAQVFTTFVAAEWATDLDLTAESGFPACMPKLVVVQNNTTAAEDVEIWDEGDNVSFVSIPPGVYPFVFRGVKTIGDGTGSNIEVTVGWDRLAPNNA